MEDTFCLYLLCALLWIFLFLSNPASTNLEKSRAVFIRICVYAGAKNLSHYFSCPSPDRQNRSFSASAKPYNFVNGWRAKWSRLFLRRTAPFKQNLSAMHDYGRPFRFSYSKSLLVVDLLAAICYNKATRHGKGEIRWPIS